MKKTTPPEKEKVLIAQTLPGDERYESIFHLSPAAVYLLDLDGRIIEVNRMACLQTGYTKADLEGLTVFDLHLEKPGLPTRSVFSPRYSRISG